MKRAASAKKMPVCALFQGEFCRRFALREGEQLQSKPLGGWCNRRLNDAGFLLKFDCLSARQTIQFGDAAAFIKPEEEVTVEHCGLISLIRKEVFGIDIVLKTARGINVETNERPCGRKPAFGVTARVFYQLPELCMIRFIKREYLRRSFRHQRKRFCGVDQSLVKDQFRVPDGKLKGMVALRANLQHGGAAVIA